MRRQKVPSFVVVFVRNCLFEENGRESFEFFMGTMTQTKANVYLIMPLSRVIEDARAGVSAARVAWRIRDKDGAARELGHVIEPGEQAGKLILEREK